MLNLKIKPLSFSYVVVWKRQLTNIPPLDAEFCKNLFENPNKTEFGFNQQGLTISLKNDNPPPPVNQGQNNIIIQFGFVPENVQLGYQRFSHFNTDLDKFYEVHSKLINELKTKYSAFYSTLQSKQVGINVEFELEFTSEADLKRWSSNQFFAGNKSDTFQEFNLQQFRFQLIEDNKNKYVLITLSPRVGVPNALHCLINDHFGISPTDMIFDLSQMKNYLSKTIEKARNVIIPQFVTYNE